MLAPDITQETEVTAPAGDWYRPGTSCQAFHESRAFVRVLIGGRGAGKTCSVAADVIRHIYYNAGSKCIALRKTEVSQSDSTIETLFQVFENMGPVYQETEISLFRAWNNGRSFRVPSRMAIEAFNQFNAGGQRSRMEIKLWLETEGNRLCGWIELRGLPHVTVGESKLRGLECSYMWHVEADQISQKDYQLSLACLRWKGADPATCDANGFIHDACVVLDTNPPGKKHWIAQMEESESKKPEHDRRMAFWHISTFENERNLPPDYIRDMIMLPYEANPAMIQRMLYGQYADAYEGKPVLYAFRSDRHEARGLGWPKGALCVVGMDVGTHNASIISAFKPFRGYEYWWCMREVILTGSDTDRQCVELLKVLANEFPFWNQGSDVCPQTLFYCDPAAANSNFSTGPTSSSVKVMNTHGIYPGTKLFDRGLTPTIAVMNRMLQQCHQVQTAQGLKTVWQFKIDVDRCPVLADAFRGAYRFPLDGEAGYSSGNPLKGDLCGHVDHPCFIAGTMIATARGMVPIEKIRVGDLVFTRNSLQPVEAVGARRAIVKKYLFSDGTETTCTPDHPYWCNDKQAMIPVDLLTHKNTISSCNERQKKLFSMAGFFAGILNQNDDPNALTSEKSLSSFIVQSGSIAMEKFQKATTSTTATEILSTTLSKIWNAWRPTNIYRNIGTMRKDSISPKNATKYAPSQNTGTAPRKGKNGTSSRLGSTDLVASERLPVNAMNAGSSIRHESQRAAQSDFASALQFAAWLIGERRTWTLWTGFARYAARFFASTSTGKQRHVRVVAGGKPAVSIVFNLTVATQHEYYANGHLVSNCDALRYSMMNVLSIAREFHPEDMTAKPRVIVNPEPRRKI